LSLVALGIVSAIAARQLAGSSQSAAAQAGPATIGQSTSAAAATGSGAASTPSSSPTTSPAKSSVDATPTATPTQSAAATADALVGKLTAELAAGGYSIAATNTVTGQHYQTGATSGMDEGSIVKIDILETLLLDHQDSDTELSDDEVRLATNMIENSDNSAAESLFWNVGGRDGITAANIRLGLTSTVLGPSDYWGLTTTGAADQLILLRNLTSTGPLTAASRGFALGLMRDVESDQRWGAGVIADAGTTFANKNGWLGVDDDSGRWLVNSLGVVTVQGQQVLISVLTQHNDNLDDGIALVESLVRAVAPAVVRQ
jgi:hypothetical protein